MKAVIMAGGEGTRLRPMTCEVPKPMMRLCGKPILEYILELLGENGCDYAVSTLGYLPRVIEEHFESGEYKGVQLEFVVEETPLGTAGSVRNAAQGFDEDFIVISGDCMCDFSLKEAVEFHKAKNAMATIVVKKVDDPREYGLVVTGKDGKVTGFVEKPDFAQAVSDLANTGVYILNPKCLSMIPQTGKFDFAKDLFPLIMEQDGIYAYEDEGYWCDIGDLNSYRACSADLMAGKIRAKIDAREVEPGIWCRGERPRGSYTLIAPAYLGENVRIGSGSVIGPAACIDDNAVIGAACRISQSLVGPYAFVKDHVGMTGAILGDGVLVKTGAALFEGAAAGDKAVIGRDAVVCSMVRIWPTKTVEDGSRVSDNLKFGFGRSGFFDEDGISGETGGEITPEFCAKLGAAAGSQAKGGKIGLAGNGSRSSLVLRKAFAAGAQSVGAAVWDFGSCMEAKFSFCAGFCGLKAAYYFSAASHTGIHAYTEGGLPSTREMERDLEGSFRRAEFSHVPWNHFGEYYDMSGVTLLYLQELLKFAPYGLSGMKVLLKSSDKAAAREGMQLLEQLGCETGDDYRFFVGAGGRKLTAYDETLGYVSFDRLLAACCLMEFESGRDVALPMSAPRLLDELAGRYERTVFRYFDCPAGGSDKQARQAAVSQLWSRDGLAMAVKLLSYLNQNGLTLRELMEKIPEFALATKFVPFSGAPGKVMRRFLGGEKTAGVSEGVVVSDSQGAVFIKPLKRGTGFKIIAEAANFETALELCDGFERKIKTE